MNHINNFTKENQNTEQKAKEHMLQVLDQIKKGKVTMTPRFYFTLRFTALIAVSVLLFIFSSFFFSFLFFALQASGYYFLFGFGLKGFTTLIILFPWSLFLIQVLLLALIEWLLKGFSFGYKTPLAYLILGIVGISMLLGLVVYLTPLHDDFESEAKHNNLPVLGGLYDHVRRPSHDHGIYNGTVIAISTSSIMVKIDDAGDVATDTLVVMDSAALQLSKQVSLGQGVFIAGEIDHEKFIPYGIHITFTPATPTQRPEFGSSSEEFSAQPTY